VCVNYTETCQDRKIIGGSALNYIFKNSASKLFMHRNCWSQSLYVCKLEYFLHTMSIVDVGA